MAGLGRACGSGLVTTDGGGASAVGAAAGAALSRSDALSPVADATVAASLVGDGSTTQRIGDIKSVGRFGYAQTRQVAFSRRSVDRTPFFLPASYFLLSVAQPVRRATNRAPARLTDFHEDNL